MEILSKNLEVLKNTHKGLYKTVLRELKNYPSPEILNTDVIKKESENFWKSHSLSNPLFINFYGLGSGQHIKDYFEKPDSLNKIILVFEKNWKHFLDSLASLDWSNLIKSSKVHLVIGLSDEKMENFLENFFLQTQALTYAPSLSCFYWDETKNDYKNWHELFIQKVNFCREKIKGNAEDNFQGFMNVIKNSSLFSQIPLLDELKNLFHNKPGLVVSTGPSLNETIKHLEKIKDKVIIIAVDSAVSILIKHNIKPHFVTSIERVLETKTLIDSFSGLNDVAYIVPPSVHPQTLEAYLGPKFFICPQGLRFNWLVENANSHYLGKSAATLAFKALDILGCNPIYLAGQDLAFDRFTNKSHAQGAHQLLLEVGHEDFKKASGIKENNPNLVLGNNNEKILSNPYYKSFAQGFEHLIKTTQKTTFNVIPINYGMKIFGTRHLEPNQLSDHLTNSLDNSFEIIKNRINEIKVGFTNDLLKLVIKNTQQEIHEINQWCLDQTKSLCDFFNSTLRANLNQVDEQNYLSHLDSFEIEITDFINTHHIFNQLIWPLMMNHHIQSISHYYKIRSGNDEFIHKAFTQYQILIDWFKEVSFWSLRVASFL